MSLRMNVKRVHMYCLSFQKVPTKLRSSPASNAVCLNGCGLQGSGIRLTMFIAKNFGFLPKYLSQFILDVRFLVHSAELLDREASFIWFMENFEPY